MDSKEEFQGILKDVTSQDLQDILNSLPDPEEEREQIITSDSFSSHIWGSSSSLKYRRDY